ncbi:glutaredoxin family protein [Gryllotalpicola sp.]|uniref:glutaredoxin family protein n=1 Tax=Gryllotalpicola sp. TaxID=1932787 RepID=UPI003415A314
MTITLYTRPGCHLCTDARAAVARVVASVDPGIVVDEIDILSDPVLVARYGEEIPVVLVDGRMHSYWRVDEDRLEKALRNVP